MMNCRPLPANLCQDWVMESRLQPSDLPQPVSAVRIGPLDAALRYLGVPTLLAALTWWAADMGYLFAHTLAEVFSIVVAMTALVVASTSVSS